MFCCARLRLHPQKRTVLGREMKDTMRERRVSAKARRESVKVRKESMRVRRELMKETMRERRAVSRRVSLQCYRAFFRHSRPKRLKRCVIEFSGPVWFKMPGPIFGPSPPLDVSIPQPYLTQQQQQVIPHPYSTQQQVNPQPYSTQQQQLQPNTQSYPVQNQQQHHQQQLQPNPQPYWAQQQQHQQQLQPNTQSYPAQNQQTEGRTLHLIHHFNRSKKKQKKEAQKKEAQQEGSLGELLKQMCKLNIENDMEATRQLKERAEEDPDLMAMMSLMTHQQETFPQVTPLPEWIRQGNLPATYVATAMEQASTKQNYPYRGGGSRRGRDKAMRLFPCMHCNQMGYWIRDCPKYHSDTAQSRFPSQQQQNTGFKTLPVALQQ
ncbi:unnamed protein product [Boreogadus saida]